MQAADQSEREAWIRMGLEFLAPDDLQVVVLRDFDKLGFTAIGEQLGKSQDAARMHHCRAVDKLSVIVGRLRRGEIADILDVDRRERDPEGPEP